MTKTISDYTKEILESRFLQTREERQRSLDFTLKKIKFLESIYMTGGENNYYSKEFTNLAVKERDELCFYSSALYSLLKN